MNQRRSPDGRERQGMVGTWLRPWRWSRSSRRGDPATSVRRDRAGSASPEGEWRRTIRVRVGVLFVALAVCVTGIEARLIQLQVLDYDEWAARAENAQERVIQTPAERGDIVDRDGQLLAYSVEAHGIAADPSLVDDPAEVAAAICEALEDCSAADRTGMVAKLSRSGRWVSLRTSRQVSPDQANRVAALKLPSVILMAESRRYYPNVDLAAHLLGFVGSDNEGLAGIERVYDDTIRGEHGVTLVQRDARLKRLATTVQRDPTAGATLELTIDQQLQYIAERFLALGVAANRADGGTAIIMDSYTGEILALANAPTFNPNDFGRYPAEIWRNRALQEIYEPGSTFKLVTAAAALEEHVLSPTTMIDCSPGYIALPGRARPVSDVHAYGLLSFEDVIVKSSNVGAIKIGLQVGAERMIRYVHRFGFGQTLAPDFAGESAGIVRRPDVMSVSALGSMSMGYEIGVTPIQMAAAVSSIANGGELYEPHIVRAVTRDGVREEAVPTLLRRTVSPQTAAILTMIMEGVVDRGTATAAQLDGFRVAGKTGTAAKAIQGGYSQTDFNASFVGFVPSRNPVFTILVVVDTPRGASHYGGAVAAPIFRQIADAALRYAGVVPTVDPDPPVRRARVGEVPQLPRAVSAASRATPVRVALSTEPGVMPDVRGLPMRDAVRELSRAGLAVRVNGSGFVASQTPAPGVPITGESWSVLRLRTDPDPVRPSSAPSGVPE